MHDPDPSSVPRPAVPAEAYDHAYYRSTCAGHAEWSSSDGRDVASIYPGILARAAFRPGEVVVDVGTGRGELVAVAAAGGARRAIGIDYAEAAVELAQHTLRAHEVEGVAEVRLADARRIPVDDATADLVTLVDVVEHLAPDELAATLREVHRILVPGGRVFAHTMPNRLVYDVTYRLHRAAMWLRGRRWPRDPRNDYEHRMHVNEQTRRGLARTLRAAGFAPVTVEYGHWVHTEFVPDADQRALYHRLAGRRTTRWMGAADLFALGTRPGPST